MLTTLSGVIPPNPTYLQVCAEYLMRSRHNKHSSRDDMAKTAKEDYTTNEATRIKIEIQLKSRKSTKTAGDIQRKTSFAGESRLSPAKNGKRAWHKYVVYCDN